MRNRFQSIAITLVCFGFLVPISVYCKNPEPVDVPVWFSAEKHTYLTDLRSALIERRDALRLKIAEHNEKSALEGSEADEKLRREAEELEKAKQEYWSDVLKFNKDVFNVELNTKNEIIYPTHAPLTNDQNDRSAYNYSQVIDQFKVETSLHYAPDEKYYCNIFVWDVTRAMNAEIPHWVKGKRTKFKDLEIAEQSAVDSQGNLDHSGAIEMNTYQTIHWLKTYGEKKGWHRAGSVDLAQQKARDGHPTIAIEPGHMAIVRPGGQVIFAKGPAIAQAGKSVEIAKHMNRYFLNPKRVEYWYHE